MNCAAFYCVANRSQAAREEYAIREAIHLEAEARRTFDAMYPYDPMRSRPEP